MYRAKAGGRNTLRFFEPAMQAAAEIRLEMETALREGIAAREFEIYLQPQMQSSGEISSSEVLVRWNRPGYGIMAPHEFMAVAEESGLIVPLGKWILEAACRMIRVHREAGRPLGISLNVSSREFRSSNFTERVREALEQTGADPARLTLELTESAVIEDISDATRKMNQLCEWGIRFAIDNFGTGYSSLAYLKQLPIGEIKIDRSFVADVVHDPNDAAIIDAALAMASRLGLKVIVEGVESAEQVQFLERLGCRLFQGFFFCPPLPVDDYFAFLRAQEQKS
jgi:EAL domain-containing protein (putative c-di-GMP-specific phosphodiesterase class I)